MKTDKVQVNKVQIAVLIALRDRRDLNTVQTLRAVHDQTRAPDFLVVVDDSKTRASVLNGRLLAVEPLGCRTSFRWNHRSRGTSGSWNTGLDSLLDEVSELDDLYVAFLNVGDSWDAAYLAQCEAAAVGRGADIVVADADHLETEGGDGVQVHAPASLAAAASLAGEPSTHASNLFVRFSTITRAGGFDEALHRTRVHDMFVRMSELGDIRYSRIAEPLVRSDLGRSYGSVSMPDNRLHADLDAFWLKYVGRMNAEQRALFIGRAATRCGWAPPSPRSTSRAQHRLNAPPTVSPFSLLIGVISSDAAMLAGLLHGLSGLSGGSVASVSALVLDNGCCPDALDAVVEAVRHSGIRVVVFDIEQQQRDAARGVFGTSFRRTSHAPVSIAHARTMLQRYLGASMQETPNSVGWVLDDDMRITESTPEYLPYLPAFREAGVDVLIGSYEGSSPNPPLNGLRVHLVDLLHNLHWLDGLASNAPLPNRSTENACQREQYPDYYYDLSRKHYAHLESPHWIVPERPGETVGEARARLVAGGLPLLSGVPLTRPLLSPSVFDPVRSAMASVNRGGNTFVLNSRALTDTPNTSPNLDGSPARRSDMIWAIVNRHYRGMVIQSVGFPVLHLGRFACAPQMSLTKVRKEIVGATLYGALTEFLRKHPNHDLAFCSEEVAEITRRAQRHLDRRWRAVRWNFARITGLRDALRAIDHDGEFRPLLDHLNQWFTPGTFAQLRKGATAHDEAGIAVFLRSLRTDADDYYRQSATADTGDVELCYAAQSARTQYESEGAR